VNGKGATSDIKLKKTKISPAAHQRRVMMSIPGTEEQKAGLLIASAATRSSA